MSVQSVQVRGRVSVAGLVAMEVAELRTVNEAQAKQIKALRKEVVDLKVELGRRKYRRTS